MSALDTMTRRQSRVTFAPCSAPGFRPRARRWLFGLVAASIAAAGCSAPQTPSSVEEARAEVPGPQPIPAPPVARPTPGKQEPSGASPAGALRSRSIGRHVMGDFAALAFDRTDFNTEQYDFIAEQGFLDTLRHPLSTFSVDVDTAAYANVRRILRDGQLPSKGAVRIEELLNYFHYDYPEAPADAPFSVVTEVMSAPWAPEHPLVMIGLQGRRIPPGDVPPRNLTFLLDVSGSMSPPNKLPLVVRAMSALVAELRAEDRVAIVVYAGATGLVLPPTSGADRAAIQDALSELHSGGGTAGAAGIELAYEVARQNFDPEGINRVILATDGDFNIGVSDRSSLVELIERERDAGVFLTVLGVGTGNLKDATMEQLADRGNGNYAYLDSLAEARKVLVHEAGSTLVTIAKDVKIQVEFNPAYVAAYRLIGYENRRLANEDFNDDRKDAGEIGAGHTVTALYEIVPAGQPVPTGSVDPLRYQQPREPSGWSGDAGGELMTVKLRYKEPAGEESMLVTRHVEVPAASQAGSEDLRFASAVAVFGMMLRDSAFRSGASWDLAFDLARTSTGADPQGYRAEFVRLVSQARDLAGETTAQ